MKIIVGSQNRDKLKIVKDALTELHLKAEVEGVKIRSGIAGQPLDKKATKKGAVNRAKDAREKVPDADFWVGLEGGLHDYGEGYHLVTIACLIDKSGKDFIGEGEEIHLPISVSQKVKNGEWFGDAIREYAKGHEIDNNLITRLSPFTQAVQNAYAEYLVKSNKLGYRKKVSGVVTDNEGKYLIVQLTTYSEGHWNFSGGGIEKGEEPEETILRELREELGSDKFKILKRSSIKHKYEYPPQAIAKRLRDEGRTWLGQEVAYFQLLFTGSESDINPDPVEIRHVKWVDYKELESHFIIPNQWEVTEKVIQDLGI